MAFLFRRRRLPVPTLWGWLLLLLLLVGAAVAWVLGVYRFLAVNEPVVTADGRGARVLVIEGWLGESELDQAIAAFRRGHYEHVVTTGGPLRSWRSNGASFAERAARYLVAHGLDAPPPQAVVPPASALERTFQSAVSVREWAARSGIVLTTVDVFSAGAHARRSRLNYRMALGRRVAVGMLAAVPEEYGDEPWWQSSAGAKTVIGESLSLVWTSCCFWPSSPAPD